MKSVNYKPIVKREIRRDKWQNPLNGVLYVTGLPSGLPNDVEEQSYVPEQIVSEGRVLPPKSRKSWSKTKSDGDIKITPYKVWKVQRSNYLVHLSKDMYSYRSVAVSNGLALTNPNRRTACSGPMHCHYNVTYAYPAGENAGIYTYIRPDEFDVDKRDPFPPFTGLDQTIESLKGSIVAELETQFDFLTAFAESRESVETILGLISDGIKILRNWRKSVERYDKLKSSIQSNDPKELRRLLKDLDKRFRDEWLRYRYGIMPIILSIEDVIKLLRDSPWLFKKAKDADPYHIDFETQPRSTGNSFYYKVSGVAVVRVVGKGRFDSSSMRLIDQIGVNPLVTAQELVPYSFVLGWFLNISDVLHAFVKSWSGGIYSKYCYSVKYEFQVSRYARIQGVYPYSEVSTRYEDIPCSYARNVKVQVPFETDTLSYIEKYESYVRVPFTPSDVKLTLNPTFLNWRRMIDSYALSFKSLNKAIKALRS